MEWDFRVRGYAGPKHPKASALELLGETSHKGVSSAQVEVQMWQYRCKRGDASHCELIDCRPGRNMKMLTINASTDVDWKALYQHG